MTLFRVYRNALILLVLFILIVTITTTMLYASMKSTVNEQTEWITKRICYEGYLTEQMYTNYMDRIRFYPVTVDIEARRISGYSPDGKPIFSVYPYLSILNDLSDTGGHNFQKGDQLVVTVRLSTSSHLSQDGNVFFRHLLGEVISLKGGKVHIDGSY